MRSKYILIGLLFFVARLAFTQTLPDEIPDSLSEYYSQRKEIAIDYALAHNMPIREVYSDGTIIEIQYLDEAGKPLYFKTFNSEAAFTTGTNKLYEGSDLGLTLSGKGIKVGIWDGGLVRATHVEFENRAQIVEGSSVSGHATHVTGTILAKGINPAAKGMAFEAHSVNYDGLNGDNAEMKVEAENGLLLSNHSYGAVLGWNYNSSNGSWQWFGDVSISDLEDYRFGYYSSAAAVWDNIAYNNPNYLIIKSAGNDRTDTGDGNGPPPDGPYDIIGPQGIAKNVLTVGSANSLTSAYSSPSDVSLAPYSSWGPTDDGRIKPDIVGMGQSVFSTSSVGDDQYTTLSGTSMASPNVTGSLALLQQQYHQQNHAYLSAAALKALVIHTAHEAGIADGPDYQYGWGLLNMEGASKMLLLNGRPGYFVKQDSLLQGATNTITIEVTAGQKMIVTIVWTDPAGLAETEAVLDPTTIKLVNDLDIRVTDGGGTSYLPWLMNPDTKQASKADNFRDNVEKIELIAPTSGTYTIDITHKGDLLNGQQNFALIVSVDDLNEKLKPFYFVGSNTDFLSPANWSDESGGAAINQAPGIDDIIIFDDNSQGSLTDASITLPDNISCFSMSSAGNLAWELELNNDTLFVQGNLSISNNNFIIRNGVIALTGMDVQSNVNVIANNLISTNLLIEDKAQAVNLLASLSVDTLVVKNSMFNTNSYNINASSVSIENSSVNLGSSSFGNLDSFTISNLTMPSFTENTRLTFDGPSASKVFVGGGNSFGVIRVVSNDLEISELDQADSLVIDSRIILLESTSINIAKMMGLSSLLIGEGQELVIVGSLIMNSSQDSRITISNYLTDAGTIASIRSEITPKLCFDFVDVTNVDVNGNTKFVVGASSTLANANGWIEGICQDVLASNFIYEFTCTGGITYFTDISDGSPDSWEWDFGDGSVSSTEQNPSHSYLDVGDYNVRLTVLKASETSTYSISVIIDTPNLAVPTIIAENNQLRSSSFADNYQWFYNSQLIPGETDYFLNNYSDPGAYYIEIWNEDCRLTSEPFVVTRIDDLFHVQKSLDIYPNPFDNQIIINSDLISKTTIEIRNLTGKLIFNQILDQGPNDLLIDTFKFKSGIYFLEIKQNNERGTYRMIKL